MSLVSACLPLTRQGISIIVIVSSNRSTPCPIFKPRISGIIRPTIVQDAASLPIIINHYGMEAEHPKHRIPYFLREFAPELSMRFGDARPLRDSTTESSSESSSMRLPASTAPADFSRSRRTSRPRL